MILKAIGVKVQMKTSAATSGTYRIISQSAQWVPTATNPPSESFFSSVTVDSSGNVYAAGYIVKGTVGFGDGKTATGVLDTVFNVLLVKY